MGSPPEEAVAFLLRRAEADGVGVSRLLDDSRCCLCFVKCVIVGDCVLVCQMSNGHHSVCVSALQNNVFTKCGVKRKQYKKRSQFAS